MDPRRLVDKLIEAKIRYGWVRGEHVVAAPFNDGEDNHHLTHRRLLPDEEPGWKRWRYTDALQAVFWWEAPTVEERDATEAWITDMGDAVDKHVFVELNSSPKGDRRRARRIMPTAKLGDDEAGILDATHYMDARTDAAQRWLRTVGD